MTATVAILAGGAGRRIGGEKACVRLAGRPLISYPLDVARRAGLATVVIAKRTTSLPDLDRTPLLLEPEHLPQHPLSGIVTALSRYPALVAVPCDMPFLTPDLLLALAEAEGAFVVAAPGSPFPGLYTASLLADLNAALAAQDSMRSVLAAAHARALPDVDPARLFSVNSADDLAEAERSITPVD